MATLRLVPPPTEGASPVQLERRFPFFAASGFVYPRSALVVPKTNCMVSRVNFFRLLLPLLLAALLPGCALGPVATGSGHYRRVRVTDPRGELVSEWIALGHISRTDSNGYRFRAVQRVSGPPLMQLARYPDGRIVEVNGPNIHISRCGAPLWIVEQFGY
jgi:hypothetical protein